MSDTVSESKSILIFGATGVIGKPITQILIENKNSFDRLVVFTSSDTEEPKKSLLAGWKKSGVQVIVGDIANKEQVLRAYEGVDTIVCALGRTAILPQIQLIAWADQTENIKRFIPSEFGTDIEHGPSSATEKPHQAKLKVRAALSQTEKLDYSYVVTGPYSDLYFGKASRDDVGTFDVKQRKAVLVGSGDDKISFCTMQDVGRLLYTVLKNPSACSKRAIKVQSFVTTPRAILAEFEKQTGSEWSVEYRSIEDLKRTEEDMWRDASPIAAVSTLRRIWITGGTLYEEGWDNDRIGAPRMQTVADTVRLVIEKQGGA